jgi:2'-5' RNA ligase
MSDIVSIELLLDPATEESIREEWERLAHAGLSSLGRHPSPSNRPHITLLVRPTLPDVPFTEVTAELPVEITLGDPLVFRHGPRAVLARRVVVTPELLDLHRAVHDAVPSGADAPHTTPGSWLPHVTLARRLQVESLPLALALLGGERSGMAIGLRRWDSATATMTPLPG